MPKNLKRGIALAVLASIAAPTVSFAQESPVEEIVVTATKRAQTLQETPVAVTVTSAETIEQAQILDINDLQSVVPSLRINTLQSSTNTNFVIRGFGNGANNPGIEPSVGVFVDGVYRSRSAGAIGDLPTLERVEVLHGPQSTLFGKNASAGVISVVTAKPSGEFGGKVSATLGNLDARVVKGEIEGAISDTIAYKFSGGFNQRDGYATNLITGGDINNKDRQNIRGDFLFTPNDNLEIRVIADYDKIDEECCSTVNLQSGLTEGGINAAGGLVNANNPNSRQQFTNIDPTNQQDNYGISTQVDYDFGNVALTSITSYREIDSFSNIDADFTSADLIRNDLQTDIETFTQEFRLTSTAGDKLDWQIGAFYFKEDVDYQDNLVFGPGFRLYADALSGGGLGTFEAASGLPLNTFLSTSDGVRQTSTLENESISLFGQFDYHFNDRLTGSFGFNYTKDEKDATSSRTQTDTFSTIDLTDVAPQLVNVGVAGQLANIVGVDPTTAAGQAAIEAFLASPAGIPTLTAVTAGVTSAVSGFDLTDADQNPFLGLQALQFLPPFIDFPNSIENGSTDDSDLSYTLKLAYQASDDVNLYISYATGFKASSFNLSRDSRPVTADLTSLVALGGVNANIVEGTRFADPEEATVIEVGAKIKFDRGSLNIAIFDQQLENFQSNTFFGSSFTLVNAESQSVKGVEFDLTYYPIDSVKLNFSGTILDPIYDEFTSAPAIRTLSTDPQTQDLSGATPAGIHDVSLSFSAAYKFNIGANQGFLRGDYLFEDEIQIVENVSEDLASRETKNLNIAAGITTPSGYSVSLWARNVTDHETLISAFPTVAQINSFNGYLSQPRTYGITVGKEF